MWSKAAIADFILEHHVGIAVDGLYDLEEKIQSITDSEYEAMCKNAMEVSGKLKSGYYFYKALDSCLSIMGN